MASLLSRILVVDPESDTFTQVKLVLGSVGFAYEQHNDVSGVVTALDRGPAQLAIINCAVQTLDRLKATSIMNHMDAELSVLWLAVPGQLPDASVKVFGIMSHPLRDHELQTMVHSVLAKNQLTIHRELPSKVERRIFQRMSGNLHCLVRGQDSPQDLVWRYGAIESISVGGVLVRSRQYWPVGSVVDVLMDLPVEDQRDDQACLRGRCVRVTPAGGDQGLYPRMAIQFEDGTQPRADAAIKKIS